MSNAVVVEGLDKSIEGLRELSRKMENKIIRKGLRAGGKVMQSATRGEAPDKSGKIRRNIKVRAGKKKRGTISISVGLSAKDFTGEAFYAGFILYGWRSGPRKLGDARKLNPANNFLKRGFDQSHEQATDTAIETMRSEVEATK